MINSAWKKISLLSIGMAVPLASVSVTFASTSFQSKYEANLSTEATLLQTARSSSVMNPTISSLSNAVGTINAEVATLYNVEQSLANVNVTTPRMNPQGITNEINTELKKRQQLWEAYHRAAMQIDRWDHHRDPDGKRQLAIAKADAAYYASVIKGVDALLAGLERDRASLWHVAPLNGGLSSLQNAILQLQSSAIQDTKEWIALERSIAPIPVPLGAPTSVSVGGVSTNAWTATWRGVPGASAYDVYVNGSLVASNVHATAYTYYNASPGTSYTVTVAAVNPANQQSAQSSPAHVTTPISVSITGISSDGWTVNWTPVPGAASYNIYVNGYKAISGTRGTIYTLVNQNPNTHYTVSVTALNGSNVPIANSANISVTTAG